MKILIRLVAAIFLAALSSHAQADYFDANVHTLAGANVATAEYSWANGRFGGYGYVDKSLQSDFVITDHEVRLNVTGPFYVNTEVGYNRFGGAMGKVGAGVNLSGLPLIKDYFIYLRVYVQKSAFGPDAGRITGVSWGTKYFQLTKEISIYISGFADIKQNAPDVIEPQVWLKFNNLPVEVGAEISIFGHSTKVSGAVKLKF